MEDGVQRPEARGQRTVDRKQRAGAEGMRKLLVISYWLIVFGRKNPFLFFIYRRINIR
jgi:hypothetical protein